MNKFAKLSLLMVGFNAVLAFFLRPKNAGPFLLGFTVLSLMGVIFACLSKKWYTILGGILLNGAAWVLFGLLVLGMGMGER
ncbi:hypothetical protein [Pradoshia sp.]|uniref:hypothetical protein n=1 Tax=Pradoshia sp. TaxID=2651281 RepID=UPI003F0940F6